MATVISENIQHNGEVLEVEFEQEEDGRWIADVPQCPLWAMAYGLSKGEALTNALKIFDAVKADL